jgi:Ca-activated chloride channel homolog
MLEPLTKAAGLLVPGDGRDRVLVLVTDGQVGNEDQILREVSPRLNGVRVHTVGIDRAVNEAFLQRLAGSSGRHELVESEDRLDEAMAHIHRRIARPLATGLTLTSTGLAIDDDSVAPSPIPDLFEGAPVVVTGRFTGAPTGSVTVGSDTDWRTTAEASPSDNPSLPALWARARIRDLEDRYVIGTGDQTRLEKHIVDTSLRFGVLSRFTAFVAIDERVVNESGKVHRVTQPVDLPSGWDPPSTAFAQASFGATTASGLRPFAAFDRMPSAPRGRAQLSARLDRPRTPGVTPPADKLTRELVDNVLPDKDKPDTPTAPPPPLPTMAAFAEHELRQLLAVANKEVWTRAALIAELAKRIKALVDHWRTTGEREGAIHSMDGLADDLLTPTDNPNLADSLWFLTLATLNTVMKPHPPSRSRRFWKK